MVMKMTPPPMFDNGKVVPLTKKRWRLIRTQQWIEQVLRPLGLDVKLDFNYHASWLLGAEPLDERFDPERGKQDVERYFARLVSRDSIVLDIGCAVGRVEKFLAPLVGELYGVDISSKAVKLGRSYVKEHANCQLLVNNSRDLSMFEDGKFDFIFSMSTFQHMPIEDVYGYLVESHRCLIPGGKVLFHFKSLKDHFDQFAYAALAGDRTATRVRYNTADELRIIFEKIGLHVQTIREGTDFYWGSSFVLAKK